MVKTRTALKPVQADAEDRSNGLEIISIGSLYNGPWDKKYWTASRGKDRYPYPVGYQAIRSHNGTTYKMEIHEGVNGPRFSISSDDGSSSSGKTPDQAWEEFQKKGSSCLKIWHGKRLLSKMDGLELFGFKNPLIQRLLRELVAGINGIEDRCLEPPNICDEVTGTDHDGCLPNLSAYPDLLLCLGKPRVTRKRSRCELKNKKINLRARPQSLELTCSRPSNAKNKKKFGQWSSATQYGSEEMNWVNNQIGMSAPLQIMSPIGKSCMSSENELPLNPIDISADRKDVAVPLKRQTGLLYSANCKASELTEKLSTEEPLHRSHDVELKVSTSLLVISEDKKLMQSCDKESVGCIDIHLGAPDTLDFVHDHIPQCPAENTYDSAPTPSKLDTNAYNEAARETAVENLLNAEHEMPKSNSNPSSVRNDFGSAGQDVAKSMMSLLLPQAVPLLRKASTDKDFTISTPDTSPSQVNSKEERSEVGCILDVPSSADVVMMEAAYEEQGEKINGPNTDLQSNTPNSEHMKSIIPDSFDYSPFDDFKTNLEILSSDILEASRSSFNEEMSSKQLPSGSLPNGASPSHASGLHFKDRHRDCDVCIPTSVLDDMSPKDQVISERSNDAFLDLKENPAHVGFNHVGFNEEMSSQQLLSGGLPNGASPSHISGLHSKERPQDFDVCIPDSVLDDMSSKDQVISKRTNDASSDFKENPAHVGFNHVGFNEEMSSQQFASGGFPNGASQSHASGWHYRPQDCNVCIPDSVLDDMSPKDLVISGRSNYASSDLKENSAHVGFNHVGFNGEMSSQQLPSSGLPNEASPSHALGLHSKERPLDCDVCIHDSVLDDMSPKDQVISERSNDASSNLKENPAHVGLNSVQKDFSSAQDFTGGVSNACSGVKTKRCHLKSVETIAETGHEVVNKTDNAETMIMSSQLPNLVYTRRKLRNAFPIEENCSAMECTEWDKFKLVTPEIYAAKGTLPPSATIQVNNSNDEPPKPNEHSHFMEPNSTSTQNPTPFACENEFFGAKEAQLISEPILLKNEDLKNNLGSSVKFVGCYMHPMPVSSLFLNTRDDEIHVCVLCGPLMGQHRTLFTYKVAISKPSFGCPSAMAHSPILLPDPKYNFIQEAMVERSGVQLTPDGQYIVLIGSIKTPNCREGKIDCHCTTCTSVCSENILKIVQVEHGYVSVVTTLETVDNVHSILVCQPNRLVSVGESGRLQVWVMNSTWSEKLEYFIIPADGSISPGIVHLKKVPKCTHLVVGHNCCGEFSLWDIAKLNCVSRFSGLKDPIKEFFPISLSPWQTKDSGFSYVNIEEHADKLLEATNLWYLEQRETCSSSPSEENVAIWLLVSTTSDLDCCHNYVSTSSECDIHTDRSWRLALLMKNNIKFGHPLDPRTTAIGVSCGYGIISTSDGVVYMWELSRGSKFGVLHHLQDGNVTCAATDDSRGALGVAADGGQLLLYLHLPKLDSN